MDVLACACAGFIDFIVVPTFTVLSDMMERIVTPLIDEASHSGLAGFRRSRWVLCRKRDAILGAGSPCIGAGCNLFLLCGIVVTFHSAQPHSVKNIF